MIIGIGSDLCDIRRVEETLARFGERFVARCFTDIERRRSERARRPRRLLRQALRRQGGLRQGARHRTAPRRVLARHGRRQPADSGKPTMRLTGGAAARLAAITPAGHGGVHPPHHHRRGAARAGFRRHRGAVSGAIPLSPPRRGEGQGPGGLAAGVLKTRSPLDRRRDRLQYAVEIAIDVVVADARDSIALRTQEGGAPLIAADFVVRRMRRTVHLDDEFGLATDEIHEIGSDRLLAHELEPVEAPPAQAAPKQALGFRLRST